MCDRCEELEERVAWLESELGIRLDADRWDRLREALRASPSFRGGAVNFVYTLYNAKGRTVTTLQMLEACPPASGGEDGRDPKIVSVWACVSRNALGADAIGTVWGRGYRLTPEGLARVAAILEPQRAAA